MRRVGQTVICQSGCTSVCKENKNWDWTLTLLKTLALWMGSETAGAWRGWYGGRIL